MGLLKEVWSNLQWFQTKRKYWNIDKLKEIVDEIMSMKKEGNAEIEEYGEERGRLDTGQDDVKGWKSVENIY